MYIKRGNYDYFPDKSNYSFIQYLNDNLTKYDEWGEDYSLELYEKYYNIEINLLDGYINLFYSNIKMLESKDEYNTLYELFLYNYYNLLTIKKLNTINENYELFKKYLNELQDKSNFEFNEFNIDLETTEYSEEKIKEFCDKFYSNIIPQKEDLYYTSLAFNILDMNMKDGYFLKRIELEDYINEIKQIDENNYKDDTIVNTNIETLIGEKFTYKKDIENYNKSYDIKNNENSSLEELQENSNQVNDFYSNISYLNINDLQKTSFDTAITQQILLSNNFSKLFTPTKDISLTQPVLPTDKITYKEASNISNIFNENNNIISSLNKNLTDKLSKMEVLSNQNFTLIKSVGTIGVATFLYLHYNQEKVVLNDLLNKLEDYSSFLNKYQTEIIALASVYTLYELINNPKTMLDNILNIIAIPLETLMLAINGIICTIKSILCLITKAITFLGNFIISLGNGIKKLASTVKDIYKKISTFFDNNIDTNSVNKICNLYKKGLNELGGKLAPGIVEKFDDGNGGGEIKAYQFRKVLKECNNLECKESYFDILKDSLSDFKDEVMKSVENIINNIENMTNVSHCVSKPINTNINLPKITSIPLLKIPYPAISRIKC